MRTMMRLALVAALVAAASLGGVRAAWAGTLDEMQAAVNTYYASGAISDADVKATLTDLVTKAKAAPDADAKAAYRASFIDVVNAFTGSTIQSAAAAELVQLAQ
jgi:hypothetical protein